MSLPVVVVDPDPSKARDVVGALVEGYRRFYGEDPSGELVASWSSSVARVLGVLERAGGFPAVLELPLFGSERADFVVVGRGRALVVEAKGWSTVEKLNYVVQVDGLREVDPCYQVENYVSKLKYFSTAADRVRHFDGVAYLYGGASYSDGCRIARSDAELEEYVGSLGSPGDEGDVEAVASAKFTVRRDIVEFLRSHRDKLLKEAARFLASEGYGLGREQLVLVHDVLEALEAGSRKAFFVRGGTGSGKTLVALTLLFEAVSRGYHAVLAYKNNRLLNTLRYALSLRAPRGAPKLSALIVYYSTGRGHGLGERRAYEKGLYRNLNLAVLDEAQRMTLENIEYTMKSAPVTVYFYDDKQILIGYEEGFRENFLEAAERLGLAYDERELKTLYRVPPGYVKLVESLVYSGAVAQQDVQGYDIKVFDNPADMLEALQEKANKGFKVALVCAFTETRGDKNDLNSPENRRLTVKRGDREEVVTWLMDEKEEYPKYWCGELGNPLTRCASVYGAQGFEADYVGVVWGRDMVWRCGPLGCGWSVNPDAITDYVGGQYSLEKLARKDPGKALELLKNRYYIMLTRGIKGTYIYPEDGETGRLLREVVEKLQQH
ncbi:DNA/RNA helicase domain-containing protein [Thermofilum pendens]|uniref:DNA/RNA helicase domain-containing protein n=1 Tax=Thermofilum pendens TaxID=2269 RepID=UPI00069AF008|nr:DNA/RNA helicase domain-containing protein [Thermofilum pendens]